MISSLISVLHGTGLFDAHFFITSETAHPVGILQQPSIRSPSITENHHRPMPKNSAGGQQRVINLEN